MRWDDFRRSDNVEDDRDGGGGGGMPGGFGIPGGGGGLGIGTVVVLGLVGWALGIDPSLLIGGAEILTGGNSQSGYVQQERPRASRTAAPDDQMGQFVAAVLGDTEDTWTAIFQQNGQTYKKPKLRLFSGSTPTQACGMAQSAMGPFYCPGEQRVYLDTSFFKEMQTRFRACSSDKACEFAEAYVIAHEIGHHVQNQLGILGKARQAQERAGSRAAANAIQVRVELQADCFGGVWANRSNNRRAFIDPGDVDQALQTASAIGDDRLQKQMQGRVVPDSFTHGTSEQRKRWFMNGFNGGKGSFVQHVRRGEPVMAGIDETRQFIPLKIAVLTISDTRELADDKSGGTLVERIGKAGHAVGARAIVSDDVEKIRAQVKTWIADPAIDVIVTTGGTGFTGRDVTPEAIEPLFDKRMDGFATMFLIVSHAKIGTSAVQTRATAGVAGTTFIFCLPGSPGACKDGWDEILVHQLDYRYRPCNFVEIMPRLDEHLKRGKAKSA